MKFRKSVFAVSTAALLFAGWIVTEKTSWAALRSRQVADGCDPVPLPYPKPTRGLADLDAGKSIDSGVLVADGCDPVPLPYPRRIA